MVNYRFVSKLLQKNGYIPNNPKLPLLIYQAAVVLSKDDPASEFEKRFHRHHWIGSWRDKVYPYHHYHTTNHEALGVYSGSATVLFGGDGEGGFSIEICAGDVVVIPAGVSHKCLSASSDFGVVGAYPDGIAVDECLGNSQETHKAENNLAKVPLPKFDPVFGGEGPLLEKWINKR